VSDSGPFVLGVVYLSEQSNLRIGKLYNAIRELGNTLQTDVSSKRQIDAQIQKTLTFMQKHEEKLHEKHESLNLYCDAKTAFRLNRESGCG
jgi:hypothetical protein